MNDTSRHPWPFTVLIVSLCAMMLASARNAAQHNAAQREPTARFEHVDVFIDPRGRQLAAYQFELKVDPAVATIVGIEGGEHAAFQPAPYYDPAALTKHRVIVGALNTGDDLPNGKTRVARLHVRVTAAAKPKYDVQLTTAADAQGARVPGDISAAGKGQPE